MTPQDRHSRPHQDRPLPAHHVPEDLLLDHAAGSLAHPLSLLVAAHLALCADCRAAVAHYEALGGALLDALEPEPLLPGALEGVFARIDALGAAAPAPASDGGIAEPLGACLRGTAAHLPWRRVARGMAQIDLEPDGLARGAGLRLLRLAPGFTAPRHSHLGSEVTLVLQGEFSDHRGRYRRGDVCLADPSVDHRPSVGGETACLCLAYQDAPLRLTGPLGRWLNPFVTL